MKKELSLRALASLAVASYGGLGTAETLGNEEWQALFKNPNATGTYNFKGYNVSEPSPANKTIDGWSATIQVANVTDDPRGGAPYPGIDISVQAPKGMKLPALNGSQTNSSNWHVCVSYWKPGKFGDGTTDDAQNDDGDCSSFLSEECTEALRNAAFEYRWDGKGCSHLPSVPEPCAKYYSGKSPGTFGNDGKSNLTSSLLSHITDLVTNVVGANLSVFDGSSLISEDTLTSGQDAMSQEDAYDYAVRGVWTVLINWGRQSNFVYSRDDVMQPTLLCLRPRNITNGSEDPNAGTRVVVYGPLGLFITLLSSTLLLL
ncbi:hypothetical protein FGRMN_9660 [Fusarium graminum]|nr:hypothetical protein FGRMN_9660 [Fusarium graminum]